MLPPLGASSSHQYQPVTSSAPPTDASQAKRPDPSTASIFSFAYYQAFFDVSTHDIRDRLLASLNPVGPPFFHNETMRADLYGPFWIITTVVFFVAVAAHFAEYLMGGVQNREYDFEKISLAATMFYTSAVFFPIVVYFILSRLNASRPLINIVALYGYSFTAYIPASIICAIPSSAASWTAVSVAFFFSTIFLVRNIYSYILAAPVPTGSNEEVEQHKKLGLLLVLGIVAVHFGIAVAVKLYFFKY